MQCYQSDQTQRCSRILIWLCVFIKASLSVDFLTKNRVIFLSFTRLTLFVEEVIQITRHEKKKLEFAPKMKKKKVQKAGKASIKM